MDGVRGVDADEACVSSTCTGIRLKHELCISRLVQFICFDTTVAHGPKTTVSFDGFIMSGGRFDTISMSQSFVSR